MDMSQVVVVRIGKKLRSRGFTAIELIISLVLFGALIAIALPSAMRVTPRQEVSQSARQLLRDLEQARMRAIAAKRVVRMSFDPASGFYAVFMDSSEERNGVIGETEQEARAAGLPARGSRNGIPALVLPKRVEYGFGQATQDPLGNPSGDPIVLNLDRIEFDQRGMVRPVSGVRSAGVIVLAHESDPTVVAAVTISPAGSVRMWEYRGGKWQ